MRGHYLMFNLKVFLFITLLPLAYLVYHLIGFESGLNAYFQQTKIFKNEKNYQNSLINQINSYKSKIVLLDDKNINLDFLEEKSFDLGKSPANTYTVIINSQ